MEDRIERESLIKELYSAFSKYARDEWIASAMKITGNLSMVEFIDACKKIETEEMMPHNLGAAIYRNAMEARYNARIQYHNEVKNADLFSGYSEGGAACRYLRLITRTLKIHLSRDADLYKSFWDSINILWIAALDKFEDGVKNHFEVEKLAEIDLCIVMDSAEKWCSELKMPETDYLSMKAANG